MAYALMAKTATAAPAARKATSEAVGTLLTASPGSVLSFPVLSAAVGTVWTACKQLPVGVSDTAWAPFAIAMLLSLSSFLLNLPVRDGDGFRLRLWAGILLIPINGALLAAAALGGTDAADAASDKLGTS